MRASILAVALLLTGSGTAAAQSLSMNIDSREQYAGVPFVLTVRAEGFAEQPEPAAPDLAITGCQVEHAGTVPEVQTHVDLNRRTQIRKVTYNFRYQATCPPGSYRVPPVTLAHQGQKATAGGGQIEVQDISTSPDMKLQLELPERPMWVGESFDLHLDWLLRRDVQEQTFAVPLFEMEGMFQVAAPETGGRQRGLAFEIGGREVMLPIERSQVVVDGREFVRLRLTARVTPLRAGAIELPPAQVVAAIQVGQTRDRYGFPVARTELFKAATGARTLTVKPLPLTGRPADFTGAVGSRFSLEAAASRTVVGLGEPIELTLRVRSDRDLTGLSAPKLDVPGALDADRFSLVGEPATGTLSDDAHEKTFKVTVRLEDASVDKIPALPLSYFDPATGEYHTVRSEPIALSVRGSAIVGADDVVGGQPTEVDRGGPSAPPALVGADLALSEPGATLDRARSLDALRIPLALLYLVPLLILAAGVWYQRTRGRREASGEVSDAWRRVRDAAEAARTRPARDAAPALATALRDLARTSGGALLADDQALLERLETEAFAPDAADHPLPDELRAGVAAAADRLRSRGRAGKGGGARAGAAVVLVLAGLAVAGAARADGGELERARQQYQEALAASDRDDRVRAFAGAATAFGELAKAYTDRPALLVDWGNASLGAGDLGRAALAYRRALALDPGAARARRNLAWVRDRMPSWAPRPPERGAIDSLFFWHHRMTAAGKHLAAALAFAIAILLLVPWPTRRRPLLRRLAILPAALWVAMLASALLHPRQPGAAVVLGGEVALRSADSPGAPAALASPLPAGLEVAVREQRGDWTRIELADGTTGWVPQSAVARIER